MIDDLPSNNPLHTVKIRGTYRQFSNHEAITYTINSIKLKLITAP